MRRIGLLTLLTLALGCYVSAGYAFPTNPQQKQQKKKASREAADRSEYYRTWLNEDVLYIISPEEKSVFKELKTDEEREKFIEQFWARRNPDPRGGDNAFKEEHYRRIAYANERFASGLPGWKTDRGRVYIMYGKPDEIDSHPSGGSYQREIYEGGGQTSTFPFERWRYRHIDSIGDDIEIEFVDKSMSGEYRMAMDPDEKDALLMVPGAGQTLAEEMGLQTRADRITGINNSGIGMTRAKDMPFARMEQYFAFQRPPQIKFEDLKSVVSAKVTYNQLPYAMRMDFIRLADDKVLVPVTVEMSNRDLQFNKDLDINRASVNVYGMVTSLTGHIMAEFEDTISTEYSDADFAVGKNARSEYQKIVALPPGQRYKLDLVLKDVNSGVMGAISRGINVPKYETATLQASTVILANYIQPAPETNQLGQFVIGDLKVQPNVKAEYIPGQDLIPYMQVYNATIDQTTQKPSVEVSYAIKAADGKVIEELQDLVGNSVEFFSGARIVVVNKIRLKDFAPGKYSLEIKVKDLISNQTISGMADFKVNEAPIKPAVAAKP
jgi:GWxTD domain-containing protein